MSVIIPWEQPQAATEEEVREDHESQLCDFCGEKLLGNPLCLYGQCTVLPELGKE